MFIKKTIPATKTTLVVCEFCGEPDLIFNLECLMLLAEPVALKCAACGRSTSGELK